MAKLPIGNFASAERAARQAMSTSDNLFDSERNMDTTEICEKLWAGADAAGDRNDNVACFRAAAWVQLSDGFGVHPKPSDLDALAKSGPIGVPAVARSIAFDLAARCPAPWAEQIFWPGCLHQLYDDEPPAPSDARLPTPGEW